MKLPICEDEDVFLRVPRRLLLVEDVAADRRSYYSLSSYDSRSSMSTDPDEDAFAGRSADGDMESLESAAIVEEDDDYDDDEDNSDEHVSTLLITANVGSIFEDSDRLIPTWQAEVVKHIASHSAQFVALHFQETGGKDIKEGKAHIVRQFVYSLVAKLASLGYSRHCAFFDLNFAEHEKFTALGSLYLAHDSLHQLELFNFQTGTFLSVEESLSHLGSLDAVPMCDKHKFPLPLFPDGRWSRKGYLRTRWRIDSTPLDLVNVHLFHDASNLISVESSPSVYCDFRRKALRHTLDRIIGSDKQDVVPIFVFGDFNFRLEGKRVLKKLTKGLRKRNEQEQFQFHDSSDQLILSLGKKTFHLAENHDEAFQKDWSEWTAFDLERLDLSDVLCESPLNFPPTYPFEEDPTCGSQYMRTRCPAWCDRVLYSHSARHIVGEAVPVYDVIGKDLCMGDHKPVFLHLALRPNVVVRSHIEPELDNGARADGGSNGGGGGLAFSRYVEVKDVNKKKTKRFKETTV